MTITPIMILPLVVLAVFIVTLALILWAGATGWKPRPLRPWKVVVTILAAVVAAGSSCAFYARDIRVLGWWMLSLVLVVVLMPPLMVGTSLFVRLVLIAAGAFLAKCRRKK